MAAEAEVTSRTEVYAALDSERDYQDKRWGDTLSDNRPGSGERTLDEFALYIAAYATELVKVAGTTSDTAEKLNFVRKVGGLAVACMEQHGAPKRDP